MELEERIADLERLFSDDKRDLRGLDEDESAEEWETAHTTGDPLVDKWEREIAAGQDPDLDEEL